MTPNSTYTLNMKYKRGTTVPLLRNSYVIMLNSSLYIKLEPMAVLYKAVDLSVSFAFTVFLNLAISV